MEGKQGKAELPQVTAVVIGGGQRGENYSRYALDFPDRLKVVAVAEPRKFYQDALQKQHDIGSGKVFNTWEEAAKLDKFADCVVIAVPDRLHKAPAVAFAKKGYHILLEKPMSVTYEDCEEIVKTCKENDVILAICHVLRYAPQARKIHSLIQSGAIGDLVNIQLLEPVGFWHFAHSFVRGNWRREETSTFSLLSKSCHDIDLLLFWFGDRKFTNISSFGSLHHFKKEKKPDGASSQCLDCAVEHSCPYSAKKIYLDQVKLGHKGFPVSVITEVPDIESVTEALKNGPYGRCVYDCDNDVADNQVVNIQFDDGATASFSMVAFTEQVCARQVRVFGTKGQLTCDFDRMLIRHDKFVDGDIDLINLTETDDAAVSQMKGHGQADFYAMDAFVKAVANNDPSLVLTGAEESLRSHRLCFLAEQARRDNRVIQVCE